MRIVWLGCCLLAAACASLPPDTKIPDFKYQISGGDPGQTIAFVGEKIAVQEIGLICPDGSLCWDVRFHARYRIVELLEGKYDGDVIDFVVYDHGGLARFADNDPVVIYLIQIGNQLYHHKYAYDPLYPVRGGGYATCGDPYAAYEPEQIKKWWRDDLTPYVFDPPVRFRLSDQLLHGEELEGLSQDDIREDFLDTMREFAPPAFDIKGDIVTCRMGMSAKDIAAVRMRYEYTPAREYSERRARCWKEAGLPEDERGTSVQEMYDSGYDACMKEGE